MGTHVLNLTHEHNSIKNVGTHVLKFTHEHLLVSCSVCIQLVLSQSLQYHPQMICMLFFTLRIYQNIINKYHHKLVKIIHEYTVHQIHEEGWCIR